MNRHIIMYCKIITRNVTNENEKAGKLLYHTYFKHIKQDYFSLLKFVAKKSHMASVKCY